jgi:hypothetical protein
LPLSVFGLAPHVDAAAILHGLKNYSDFSAGKVGLIARAVEAVGGSP